jgi:hypothetical protein
MDSGNFQARAGRQGKLFEELCVCILQDAGWQIVEQRVTFPEAGVEVDIIATNQRAISFYFTCKGSFSGERPGCIRTDTLKKALHEAHALHGQGWGPVVLLTSHLPDTPSGLAMLENTDPDELFDAINPLQSDRRLRWLAQASEAELQADIEKRRRLRPAPRGFGAWQPGPRFESGQGTFADEGEDGQC